LEEVHCAVDVVLEELRRASHRVTMRGSGITMGWEVPVVAVPCSLNRHLKQEPAAGSTAVVRDAAGSTAVGSAGSAAAGSTAVGSAGSSAAGSTAAAGSNVRPPSPEGMDPRL